MNKKLIFDAHTHFNDSLYEEEGIELSTMIKEANDAGIGYFLDCGFDIPSSKLAIEHANKYNNIFVAAGIHPNDVASHSENDLIELKNLAKDPKVVAIGEVGIDYYYEKESAEQQKILFRRQIEIAIENDLTLMMHIRDAKDEYNAYDDAIEIISELRPSRMIVHCFSANIIYAQKFINLGCWINIGGAVTFKNAKELQEAATWIPLEKMLVETDAPYLTPHPNRGQINFVKFITLTITKIAELKGVDFDTIVEATTTNAFEAFNINN